MIHAPLSSIRQLLVYTILIHFLTLLDLGCTVDNSGNQLSTHLFDQSMREYFQLINPPGMAIMIVNKDSIIYFTGLGYADLALKTPITKQTIFGLASLSKPITALTLSQMQQEGKLSFEDSLAQFPNKYFDPQVIESGIKIKHILSHTSESYPLGNSFLYNGNRYNMAFNVFDGTGIRKHHDFPLDPFFQEVTQRIIEPFKLTHTILAKNGEKYAALEGFVATPYMFDEQLGDFFQDTTLSVYANPASGILSSAEDLATLSQALDRNTLISLRSYQNLTQPFYSHEEGETSPYGLGWFTQKVDSFSIHWHYGYGASNASLIIRVPQKKLTLVMLSNCPLPSSTTRLGEGNVLRSLIATAFIKHCLLQLANQKPLIEYAHDIPQMEQIFVNNLTSPYAEIFTEESYTQAMVRKLLPDSIYPNKEISSHILLMIDKYKPEYFDGLKLDQFYFISQFDDPKILSIGNRIVEDYLNMHVFHPVKSYYGAIIKEKINDTEKAEKLYQGLIKRNKYWEHDFMSLAYINLASLYLHNNQRKEGEEILLKLIVIKEYKNSLDKYYKQAKEMLED